MTDIDFMGDCNALCSIWLLSFIYWKMTGFGLLVLALVGLAWRKFRYRTQWIATSLLLLLLHIVSASATYLMTT